MKIDELRRTIERAGGGGNALDYAELLLEKVTRLEDAKGYEGLLQQLSSARQSGDFRGRVLEVNFADQFVRNRVDLLYGAKQGGSGDVDFCWKSDGRQIFMELKLLGQDQATRDSINKQLDAVGESSTVIADDTRDIGRIQFDLFQKSSTTKFNSKPQSAWINLICIDVSELQLGMADICDCLLAAGGNTVAACHCDAHELRPNVVGMFERLESPTKLQKEWLSGLHRVPSGAPHPRDYMHGALFLFRKPQETATLSYDLSGAIVWNRALVTTETAKAVAGALSKVVPFARR